MTDADRLKAQKFLVDVLREALRALQKVADESGANLDHEQQVTAGAFMHAVRKIAPEDQR